MKRVLINLKEHSICISFDNSNPLYYFDKKGRLIGAYMDGRNFKRSLDDRLHQQWGVVKNGIRQRCRSVLVGSEKRAFFEGMSRAMASVYDSLLDEQDEDIEITAARPTYEKKPSIGCPKSSPSMKMHENGMLLRFGQFTNR